MTLKQLSCVKKSNLNTKSWLFTLYISSKINIRTIKETLNKLIKLNIKIGNQ